MVGWLDGWMVGWLGGCEAVNIIRRWCCEAILMFMAIGDGAIDLLDDFHELWSLDVIEASLEVHRHHIQSHVG